MINTLALSQDNKIFASGSDDKIIKIWSVNSFELKGTLKGLHKI